MKTNPKYEKWISIAKGISIAVLVGAVDAAVQIVNDGKITDPYEIVIAALAIGAVKFGNNMLKNKYNFDFKGTVSKYVKYL